MDDIGGGFDDFSVEMGDYEVKKTSKFDRMWKIGPGGSIAQIPLIHDGIIYFGSCNHNVYAVDAMTGALLWKFRTEDMVFASSPRYLKGRIYFGSYDHFFYALDAKKGELVWKFRTEGEINVIPWIWEGKVYFASKDQNVYCLDAETGRLVWKFFTQDQINACPTVSDGRLFIGSFDHNVYCLDARTGELVWKFRTQGEIHTQNPLLVHDNVLYVTSFDNYLYAIATDTGKMLWKFRTGIYGNTASPFFYKNALYLNSRDGYLFAIGLDGKMIWKITKTTMFSIPCVFEDNVYVGGDDLILHCYNLDGSEKWNFKTQGMVWMQTVFLGRTACFSSWDCNVYAVNIDTHELLWKFRASGSPSEISPPHEVFEFVMKVQESEMREEGRKRYDFEMKDDDEEGTSAYKSRITYQVSTQYSAKGKYQVDEKTEGF